MYTRSSFTCNSLFDFLDDLRDHLLANGWLLKTESNSYYPLYRSGSHEMLCVYKESPEVNLIFLRKRTGNYEFVVSVQTSASGPVWEDPENQLGYVELIPEEQYTDISEGSFPFLVNTFHYEGILGLQIPEHGNTFTLMGSVPPQERRTDYDEGAFCLNLNQPEEYVNLYNPDWVVGGFYWRLNSVVHKISQDYSPYSKLKIPENTYSSYSQTHLLTPFPMTTFYENLDVSIRQNVQMFFDDVPGVYAVGDGQDYLESQIDFGSSEAVKINNRLVIECLP